MRVTRRLLFAATSLLVAVPAAAAGELDPSFSGDGWTQVIDVEGRLTAMAADVALLPDGRILAATTVEGQLGDSAYGVVRFLPNGEIDTTFGENGLTTIDAGSFARAEAIEVQRDGAIVVGGQGGCSLRACIAVARFTSDGTADASFGEGGVARANLRIASGATDIAIQPDGRIVAVGHRRKGGDSQDDLMFAAVRFDPGGEVDRGFGKRGKTLVDFGYGDDEAAAVAVRPSGGLVVVGLGTRNLYLTGTDIAIAALRGNGSLDRRFGRRGTLTLGGKGPDFGDDVEIDGRGRILVAGSTGSKALIARLRPSGSMDRGFGRGGRAMPERGIAFEITIRGASGCVRKTPTGFPDCTRSVSSDSRVRRVRTIASNASQSRAAFPVPP